MKKIKNLPKKIFLQLTSNGEDEIDFEEQDEVTWCAEKVGSCTSDTINVPYVNAASLLNKEGLPNEGVECLFEMKDGSTHLGFLYEDAGNKWLFLDGTIHATNVDFIKRWAYTKDLLGLNN